MKYGTDPSRVIEVLEKTVEKHPDILEEPKPYAVFQRFGDSSLDFEVRGWTTLDDWLRVTTETRVLVNNALKSAGIEIPFPQRDLHLRSIDPEAEKVLAGGKATPGVTGSPTPEVPPAPGRSKRMDDQDADGDSD